MRRFWLQKVFFGIKANRKTSFGAIEKEVLLCFFFKSIKKRGLLIKHQNNLILMKEMK